MKKVRWLLVFRRMSYEKIPIPFPIPKKILLCFRFTKKNHWNKLLNFKVFITTLINKHCSKVNNKNRFKNVNVPLISQLGLVFYAGTTILTIKHKTHETCVTFSQFDRIQKWDLTATSLCRSKKVIFYFTLKNMGNWSN